MRPAYRPMPLVREFSVIVAVEDGNLLPRALRWAAEVPILLRFDHWQPLGWAKLERRGAQIWAHCRIGATPVAGLFPSIGYRVDVWAVEPSMTAGAERIEQAHVICVGFVDRVADARLGALTVGLPA
jgi:hypothetical protein